MSGGGGTGHRRARPEGGFSLMEVIVATMIATIAVVGLAYSFGTGRSLIDRFELDRAALAAATARLESLAAESPYSPDLAYTPPGLHHSAPFELDGNTLGEERWTVNWVDSGADGTGASDSNPFDLKRVTVEVVFRQGAGSDTVRLSRLFPAL